jgi:divalent metal cation (Fe/Co/Zn/Cd) transporter
VQQLTRFAIIAISIVVDFFRARTLNRVAEKTSSQALEADALHFSSDMWSSIAVLIGPGLLAVHCQAPNTCRCVVRDE